MEEAPKTLAKSRIRLRSDLESLARETAHLLKLDDRALRQRWSALFGVHSSTPVSRDFMIRSITYRLQERVFGGLKPSVQRILDQACDAPSGVAVARLPKKRATAGTVLIREWRGVRHRVTVLDDSVVYRGQRYGSLSEMARLITGTRWSGPAFFGLTRRGKEAAND